MGRRLAGGGLTVERPLACDDDGCRSQRPAQIDQFGDLAGAGYEPGAPGEQAETDAAGSARTGRLWIGGKQRREPRQSGVGAHEGGLAETLLRSEDRRRAE